MKLLEKFHCPACRSPLHPADTGELVCVRCRESVAVSDGIIDFVGDGAGTTLDPDAYDEIHQVDDRQVDRELTSLQLFAGDRWPVTLGSVLETGCGTGLFSRAMLDRGLAREAVLTDVSTRMLAVCRQRLAERGLLDQVPLSFAAYGGQENAFRDAVFDTCAGTSVLHHIPDVRAFLAEVFRMLKPRGRAFFMEPNLRFHRALMHTLADVVAQLQARNSAFSEDRQKLCNVLAEERRVILHQNDMPFLSGLENKHLFEAEAFEQMGLELGFASAEALSTTPQPTGTAIAATLCTQIGVSDETRRDVIRLMPAYASRYLGLLAPRDRSIMFLLWLEKGVGPQARGFRGPLPTEEDQYFAEEPPDPTGGLPVRYSMTLVARPAAEGISLHLGGWCLVNADVVWVRVSLNGTVREAPVWRPRPDVQNAINGAGLYPAWNALCSGIDANLAFEGVAPDSEGLALSLELVLAGGATVPVRTPGRLLVGEETHLPG